MAFKHRRVVTGLDEHGKSCVISDAPLDQLPTYDGAPVVIWRTDTYPVDNRGNADGAARFGIETFDSSSFFVLFTAEPGKPSRNDFSLAADPTLGFLRQPNGHEA